VFGGIDLLPVINSHWDDPARVLDFAYGDGGDDDGGGGNRDSWEDGRYTITITMNLLEGLFGWRVIIMLPNKWFVDRMTAYFKFNLSNAVFCVDNDCCLFLLHA